MKKIITFSLAIFSMLMLETNISKAAFPIKREVATQQNTATSAMSENSTVIVQSPDVQQKAGTDTREAKKTSKSSSTIPAILYIILAILGFGWLGMGINDNFGDFDWLISLVLYILFYIPGLIYTLIKMSKYY